MKKRYAALIFCAIGLLLGSVTSEAKKKPSVTAESAIVMDVQSGAILYEKNILTEGPLPTGDINPICLSRALFLKYIFHCSHCISS